MRDQYYRDLAQHNLRRVCVPLAYEVSKDQSAVVRGSASLFDLDGRCFLITAAHVFEGFTNDNIHKIGVPIPEENNIITIDQNEHGDHFILSNQEVITLVKGNVFSISSGIDLAFVELLDIDVISQLKKHYRFLSYDSFDLPRGNGNIIIAGWANSLERKIGERIAQKIFYFETELIPIPNGIKGMDNPELYDLFMAYDNLEEIGGGPMDPIDLRGISGGAIWRVDPATPLNKIWTAEQSMKFIGVEKSFFIKGKYIRGTSVLTFPYLFEKIDRDISDKIKSILANKPPFGNG